VEAWAMSRILRGEVLRDYRVRLRRPDQGWEKAVSYSGSMVRSAGGEVLAFMSIRDITQRLAAEDEQDRLLSDAQAERDRISALLGSIRDEVWFADTQRRFTLANPAALTEFRLGIEGSVDVTALA